LELFTAASSATDEDDEDKDDIESYEFAKEFIVHGEVNVGCKRFIVRGKPPAVTREEEASPRPGDKNVYNRS
jgi:hypothetical protein